MTPDDLIEAPLQNIGVEWPEHADSNALVVQWRVPSELEFAKVELLLY
jgi:hypothetical protein